MEDKFENDLFDMAEKEKMIVPARVYARTDEILSHISGSRRTSRMNFKKSLALATACVLMFSITVSAAVGAYKQRMEAMNEQEMEEYFTNIYTAKIGVDNYNRPYTDGEKTRMEELTASYEEEGTFPEKALMMIAESDEYKGSGVAFLGDTATFFFPDKDMSDEELLQIIDFMHKRDYSLASINEKIASGEMEFPKESIDAQIQEIEATDADILQSDVIYEPGQELTIPYTGDLEVSYMAAGQNCIFLTGESAIHKMEIGSSDSTLFFNDFDTKTYINALYQDKSGDIYLGISELVENEDEETGFININGERYKTEVWILDSGGEVKKKIDFSQYEDEMFRHFIYEIVADENGYIYIKSYMKDDSILMVFNKEGNYVTRIKSDEYSSHPGGGLGIGKDGKVYVQISRTTKDGDEFNVIDGIASVNVENSCLEDVYIGIVPEDMILIDLIAPGSDTDFVLWGYGGIYTYNLGEESAVNVLPAYGAPCEWEGVMRCALPDGRVVFGACTEYRREGDTPVPVPEKICFYYKSGLRN